MHTPTYIEFASVLDGTEHDRLFKRRAYEAFLAGERRVFYPRRPNYYMYLVDGLRGFVARSVWRGQPEDAEFVEHQRFTFQPPNADQPGA